MATNTSSNEFIVDYDNNYDATTNTFTSSGKEFRRSFLLIFILFCVMLEKNEIVCIIKRKRNNTVTLLV